MLQTESLFARIGFDTAENGPSNVWAINSKHHHPPGQILKVNITGHGSAKVRLLNRHVAGSRCGVGDGCGRHRRGHVEGGGDGDEAGPHSKGKSPTNTGVSSQYIPF